MPVTLDLHFAPAHELVMSLDAYLVTPSHRNQELGEEWVQATRARLPAALVSRLERLPAPPDYGLLTHLIRQCPDQGSITAFLHWLAGLSPGDLYERLAPFIPADGALPPNLGELRDESCDLLAAWDAAYFRHLAPAILPALSADAERLRQQIPQMSPADLVEAATGGLYLEDSERLSQIWLIPQYHKRPITMLSAGRDSLTCFYPLLDLAAPAGEPPASLLRISRTLADESRLRILYQLTERPLSFGEVVARSGLTKGTVSRHLWALRFARLIRAHYQGGSVQRYSLRPDAAERIGAAYGRYLTR